MGNRNNPDDGVSIIIPVWNRENYIKCAIDSCLSQTFENIEIIVVDDGSTDSTVNILESYGNKLRVIKTNHSGSCNARNIGWKNARYSLIKFLDSDDFLFPDALKEQYDFLNDISRRCNVERVIVFGDTFHIRRRGNIDISTSLRKYNNFPLSKAQQLQYLIENNIQTSSPLHQKNMLETVGGFSTDWNFRQEWDLHVRLSASGADFKYKKFAIANIIEHDGENRISNILLDKNNYKKMIERGNELYFDILPQLYHNNMPGSIQKTIGRALWKSGREASRLGYCDVAYELFQKSRFILGNSIPGHPFYRILVSAIGPNSTEFLLNQFVILKNRFYNFYKNISNFNYL